MNNLLHFTTATDRLPCHAGYGEPSIISGNRRDEAGGAVARCQDELAV